MTPRTVARQVPLSMGFSRQEDWSGLPCPPPGDLPDPGIEPISHMSPALAGGFSFLHSLSSIFSDGHSDQCEVRMRASPWLSSKESACNAGATGDTGSIPGSGRSPGGGHGHPLQYSCLENPMDRAAWWATVHGVAKTWTRLKRLSTHTFCPVGGGTSL